MIESVREIEKLMFRYAELQDETDLEAVAQLFTHGAFVVDKVETPARGFEEVLALKQHHDHLYADGTLRTKHVTTNVIIEVDEEHGSATAHSYYTVLQATEGFPLQAIIAGRYHDTFHRVDGKWWFNERFVFTDLIGDLSRHTVDNPMT